MWVGSTRIAPDLGRNACRTTKSVGVCDLRKGESWCPIMPCRHSSGVEHFLGKEEVEGSRPSVGSRKPSGKGHLDVKPGITVTMGAVTSRPRQQDA